MEISMEQRKRRSESLSKDEHKAFVKLFYSFPTKVDAEVYFSPLSRQVLDLVAIKGSGRYDTIAIIREKLQASKSAA